MVENVLLELAKASPYAALLVLGFFLFFHMHKHSIKTIKDSQDDIIKEIRESYKDATDKVINFYERKGKRD